MTSEEIKRHLVSVTNEPLTEIETGFFRDEWRSTATNLRYCVVYTYTAQPVATPVFVPLGEDANDILKKTIEHIKDVVREETKEESGAEAKEGESA